MSDDIKDDPKPNVFKLIDGGREGPMPPPTAPAQDDIPQNAYLIVDRRGEEHYAEGFLLFTSQHIAVMKDIGNGQGAIPILVLPLDQVNFAELLEEVADEATVELPF